MLKPIKRLSRSEVAAARERRIEHLQAIEGNPLDAEDIVMFEMFEREGWTHEQCLACILARVISPPTGAGRAPGS